MTREISKDISDKIKSVNLIKIIKRFSLWGTPHTLLKMKAFLNN